MNCYVCDTEITPLTETDEHIIINAAGGRLKSKNLICKKCNSDFGQKIDAELAKQLNHLANMLMVRRHRGNPQPIMGIQLSTGEKYVLEVDGTPKLTKPSIDQTIIGDKTNISITARSVKELRETLKGLAKKYPVFDIEEAVKSAKWWNDYFSEALHFQTKVGGDVVFRAVCKCAINFFIYNKGDVTQIKPLIPYIKGEEDKDVVWMHYQEDIYNLKPDESLHILYLVANPQEKVLYCYVDYFNTYKYLVLLNDNYIGDSIKKTYCFDLINIVPVNREIMIDYDRKTLLYFFKNKDSKPFEQVQKSFHRSLTVALKRQQDFQRLKLIEASIQDSLGKYPEGTIITEEILNKVINKIVENLTPYLVRNMKE